MVRKGLLTGFFQHSITPILYHSQFGAFDDSRLKDKLLLNSLRMQMPRQLLLAVRFGIQDIMFLKRLQLMQEKHQHDAD
jgi:hypothetical protein